MTLIVLGLRCQWEDTHTAIAPAAVGRCCCRCCCCCYCWCWRIHFRLLFFRHVNKYWRKAKTAMIYILYLARTLSIFVEFIKNLLAAKSGRDPMIGPKYLRHKSVNSTPRRYRQPPDTLWPAHVAGGRYVRPSINPPSTVHLIKLSTPTCAGRM